MIKAVLLVSLGLLWATRLSAIKSAGLSGIPVHVVVGVSTTGIAILFTAVALMRGIWPPLSKAKTLFYILSGLFGFILPFTLESQVAPQLPVFVLVVIIATMPIVTLAISAVVGHQALSRSTVSAVLLGFVGSVFLIWDTAQLSHKGGTDMIWMAIAFGVPILYAANTVFIATKWPVAADAIQVAHAQALIFSLAVLAGGLTMGDPSLDRGIPQPARHGTDRFLRRRSLIALSQNRGVITPRSTSRLPITSQCSSLRSSAPTSSAIN